MEQTVNGEEIAIVNCLKLIQQYAWLLNSFVLDFYTDNHWDNLPSSWRHVLSQISLEELGSWMMMTERTVLRVWPLSLLALRASAKAHSLPRKQVTITTEDNSTYENNVGSTSDLHSIRSIKAGIKTKCLTHQNLKNLFLRHVKPKKRHETLVLAKICADAAVKNGVCCIVDIGGGKGHLSRLLAYGFGLKTLCVEAQSDLIASAKNIDQRIEYTASKYLGRAYVNSLPCPEYIEMTVGRSNDSLSDFVEELRKHWGDNISFAIVGLHPCGDLAPTLLNIFTSSKDAKFICIASCCYMKLSVKKSDEFCGYPLSNALQKLPDSLTLLSYEALEVSCHALEAYCQRLQRQQYQELKVHCFRAVLEKLITKHWPDLKRTGLRSVKHSDSMDFPSYAKEAMSRVDLVIPPSDLTSDETCQLLKRWQQVVILYSLRLLLAPLVETAVLLDRLVYIHEKGARCHIIPGFDPFLSPRNLILQGTKS